MGSVVMRLRRERQGWAFVLACVVVGLATLAAVLLLGGGPVAWPLG